MASIQEPPGDARSGFEKLPKRNIPPRILFEQVDVDALGLDFRLAAQDLNQGSRRIGRRRRLARRLDDAVAPLRRIGARLVSIQNRPRPIGGCLGLLRDFLAETRMEPGFQAHQQFDALEAAKAQVAVERRIHRNAFGGSWRAELGEQFADHFERLLLDRAFPDFVWSDSHGPIVGCQMSWLHWL